MSRLLSGAMMQRRAIYALVFVFTIAGLVAVGVLPQAVYPNLDFSRINVRAENGDLAPTLVQASLTRPLERELASVLGVKQIVASSTQGAADINVTFDPHVASNNVALQRVSTAVASVQARFPKDTSLRIQQVGTNLFPILTYALTSERLNLTQLREAAEFQIRPQLTGLPGARLGVRPQQIAETDAQLRQATTQTALAKAQLERQQKLLELGIATQSDVDAARAALAGAKSGLDVLQQQRSTQVHPWQPDVDAAGANVGQAQSVAYGARQKLALAEIAAPFPGVVVARMHNDGESVDANAPVIQIASDSPLVFTAQFSPDDASYLSVGDPATIQAEGVSARVTARIIAINSLQGDTHTVAVLMRMHADATAARALGIGAYGEASVQVGTRRGLVVPTAAIVTDAATGAVEVFRKDGDRYDPVPIGVVARAGDRAIVSASSLRQGDRVVTEGAYELLAPAQAPKKDSD